MDKILLKHNKHRFQYADDIEYLQKLHSELPSKNMELDMNIISPKMLINSYDMYETFKIIFLLNSRINNSSSQHKKFISYFKEFEKLFMEDFCFELYKLFTQNIKNFRKNKK
jgi:hypothetical protein